ncbi:MAG TPA: hypothetical protein VLV49_11485 [Terriglobales bacterium]|nr:hypothetical protein [Terriglobales bacterium]
MYTGTLIEQLIATVELTEERLRERDSSEEAEMAEWSMVAAYELGASEPSLRGVA